MNKGALDISLINYDGELPEEFTLPQDRIPPVHDQHSGTSDERCAAYALSGIMRIMARVYFNEDIDFSEAYIYGKCRTEKTATGKGMIADTAVSLFVNYGSVPQDSMPDLKKPAECYNYVQDNPYLTTEAKKYADIIKGFVNLKGRLKTDTLENIKKALVKYQLPLFGSMDGHAVIFVGYDKKGNVRYRDSNGMKQLFLLNYKKIKGAYLIPMNEKKEKRFIDVPDSHWGKEAIEYCAEKGYMNGVDADSFDPNKPLTRAEIAQVLYNYDKAVGRA